MPKRGPKEITPEHKAAMAAGRTESRAVKNYLEALDQHRPKRGRKRTAESIDARLDKIDAELADADAMKRLSLIQERLDLLAEKDHLTGQVDLSALEEAFVGSAKAYGERKGISYAAWREVGVPAAVLTSAGIGRGTR
ncbi:MAG: hypothetical protein ACOYOP_00975 [Microthrixaceae bacterium]